MSPATEDNLGRRRFILHQEMAVEQALEKIRRAPESGWDVLSPEQRAGLKRVVAEIWENCERGRWQQYCFSSLTYEDIVRLVTLGDETRAQHRQICDVRGDVEAILLSCATGRRTQ